MPEYVVDKETFFDDLVYIEGVDVSSGVWPYEFWLPIPIFTVRSRLDGLLGSSRKKISG